MTNQIYLSSRSEARRGNARSIICRRGTWPGLLLAGCCAVLTGFAHPARAGVSEAWVHRYSNVVSNSTDQAYKVVSDAAGDVIVTGFTDDGVTGPDMLTIKYSGANGSVLWQNRYNGPANDNDHDNDEARALAVDGSGNVVITGSSWNIYLSNSSMDYYTAKYAGADGALLWERRYNGPANSYDQASAVAVDSSGNVVVTGSSDNSNGDTDYYTAKYAAADGALLWERRYNGPSNNSDYASAVAVDGSGNVVVTGYSGNGIDVNGNSTYDHYTAKYAAADGALLWEQRYNGPALGIGIDINDHERLSNFFFRGYYAQGLALDANGNVVMMGGYSYTAMYAAANGALLWEKRDIGGRAVAVDGSGNVVMTGAAASGMYTAKYAAADGALLWEKRGDGPVNGSANNWDRDEGRAVAVDGSGNVVVTGVSGWAGGILSASRFDFYTAKYAAVDGALLWEKRYDGAETISFYLPPMAVAVDRSGNVVLTGAPFSSESDTDYYTAKYAAADGVLLWEKRYSGPANREDSARAVAVDGTGNVVVTGSSISSGRNADFYTAKYAAANGALVWEKRYNSSVGEGAKAMALDGSGNVVVTGTAQQEIYTAKYAAADGALLWEKRGPLGFAPAMALDVSGNVVVTGSSYSGLDYYYTAKYAATDGALLWEKRGPGGFASAVALDGSGNVVVTGYSGNAIVNGNSTYDYYTAKYVAADGALLWEKRGPGGGASAMALDGSGNVVVTGPSSLANGLDYYTAKYAAADGALLWEKGYNGPYQGYGFSPALAVDGSGNVVVTEVTHNGAKTDYYMAKYAAATGALLWEIRSIAGGQAVAVDGSGNVVVTGGYSDGYYTAKYAAADGTLLWEIRYSGPANGNSFVGGSDFWPGSRGLALGPKGMVAVTGSSGGDYATVVYRETLPPLSIERVPTGVRLRFTGVPGSSYTIERAPAVNGPWITLNTQTAPASGLIEYLDAPPPPGQAFYRTVQP